MGVLVADINQPDGNFVAVVVLVGLRAVKKDAAPLAGNGGGDIHFLVGLRISTSDCGEIRNVLGGGWNCTGPRNRVSNWRGG